MARIIRLSLGLLAVSLLTALGLNLTASQDATPSPHNFTVAQSGLTFDGLGASPRMSILGDSMFYVVFNRLTFEPGARLELDYPGPVQYFVEEGELGIAMTDARNLILTAHSEYLGPSPIGGQGTEGETILTPGYSVTSEDGHLGPVRNAGAGRLVVYAMVVVPDAGAKIDVTGDLSATPMNEIELTDSLIVTR